MSPPIGSRLARALGLTAASLLLAAAPAHAAWGPDGSTIKATTNLVTSISAASDGAGGAVLAFHEGPTASTGLLLAQHVLSTGDPNPLWPAAGAAVCTVATHRAAVGAVEDAQGGAFVWWLEGTALYLSRITSNGQIAPGWPERGRLIDTMGMTDFRPDAVADGAGGVYLAWSAPDPQMAWSVRVIHVAGDNTPAGGWPAAAIRPSPEAATGFWPRLTQAPDGGVYVGWYQYAHFVVTRLTPAGSVSPGWPANGMKLATVFYNEYESRRLALAADGHGGVLLMTAAGFPLEVRVFRFDQAGATHGDWPSSGLVINTILNESYFGPDHGFEIYPGTGDEAIALLPYLSVHWPSQDAATVGPQAPNIAIHYGNNVQGSEAILDGRGGLFIGTFKPSGAYGPYEPGASLNLHYHNCPPGWQGIAEYHLESVISWFGDIALTSSGDGGVLFFWSQHRERFGLFARRFSQGGQVVAVEAEPARFGVHQARFVPGSGIRVRFSMGIAEPVRLELLDVTGRLVAQSRHDVMSQGTHEIRLPGTEGLPSGLYFTRLSGSRVSIAKVSVLR